MNPSNRDEETKLERICAALLFAYLALLALNFML